MPLHNVPFSGSCCNSIPMWDTYLMGSLLQNLHVRVPVTFVLVLEPSFSILCIDLLLGLGLLFLCCPVPFEFGSGYLVEGFRSHSPNKILNCSFFPGPFGIRIIFSLQSWCNINFVFLFRILPESFQPLLGVNTGFSSDAFASKFGTMFFSVKVPV